MVPDVVTTWAFAVCLVLCAATGAAWVVDGRRRAAGVPSDIGIGVLAVFAVAAVQTSGLAFLSTLLAPGMPNLQRVMRSAFTPYLTVSVVAALLMLGAQSAGVISSTRVPLRTPLRVAQVLLAVASLAALWWSERMLGSVVALEARTMVFLAPTAGAAVLTALLVVRFVSARMPGAAAAVSAGDLSRSDHSVPEVPEVAVAAPKATMIDPTPYRRPAP